MFIKYQFFRKKLIFNNYIYLFIIMEDIFNKKQYKINVHEYNGLKIDREDAIVKLNLELSKDTISQNIVIICIQILRTEIEGLKKIDEMIIDYFNKIANIIKNKLENNKLTFEEFINNYNYFNEKCSELQNILLLLNNNIYIEGKNYFMLLKINTFYIKIIDELKIYNKLFNDDTIARSDIIDLYAVFQILNNILYYIPDKSINILSSTIPSNLLINIINIINNILTTKSIKTIISQKELGLIKFLLNICIKHNNVQYFMEHYIEDIQRRLVKSNYVVFEENLLECFPVNTEYNDYVNRIINICNDVKEGNKISKQINKDKKINIRIYNKSHWTISEIYTGYIGRLNHPGILDIPCIKDPNMYYNYDTSTCVLKIDKLIIKCTLMQYCIIDYIIKHDSIRAIDLAQKLNIKLSNISDEINSLLVGNIIKKIGEKTDSNMNLLFNQDCVCNDCINLIEILNEIKILLHHENKNEKIDNILKSKICQYLLTDKLKSKDEIINHITSLHNDIPVFNITEVIDKLYNKGTIILSEGKYSLLN